MVVRAAASKCEIFASTYKCVCLCDCVCAPPFCRQHTGPVFMTDCNSGGCVVDPHLFQLFFSVAWRLSELPQFALILHSDVCPSLLVHPGCLM